MTATNHALTGALIGLADGNPWIALPAAVASHFICDALPHFGIGHNAAGTGWFKRLLVVEACLCLSIVIGLAVFQPHHWLLAAGCAFLATSPDFMWINKYRRAQAGQKTPDNTIMLMRFHATIQWFERPIGAFVEAVWAFGALVLLKLFIV